MSTSSYRKLRARGWNWSGRSRLWLGADHLLEVHSTGFTEHYRRYFLRDIRALVVERTRLATWWSVASAFVLLLCGGGTVAFYLIGSDRAIDPERFGLWILAGFFAVGALAGLIALLAQLLLGPSCTCHIETTAGRRQLAAPGRLRPAERLLAELAPLITAAQEVAL